MSVANAAKKLSDRIGAMTHAEFVSLLAALYGESLDLMRSAYELVEVFDQSFLCMYVALRVFV